MENLMANWVVHSHQFIVSRIGFNWRRVLVVRAVRTNRTFLYISWWDSRRENYEQAHRCLQRGKVLHRVVGPEPSVACASKL